MLASLNVGKIETDIILIQKVENRTDIIVMPKATAISTCIDILTSYGFNDFSTLKAVKESVKHIL
jgi:hypothetical protein